MRPREKKPGTSNLQVTARQFVRSEKLSLAREFRKKPTSAEKKAWALLRNRGILGLKFRRQQVIDGFVVDFYCAEFRLAIELDGSVHDSQFARYYDEQRTSHLKSRGISIIRLKNDALTAETLERALNRFLGARDTFPLSVCGEGTGGEVIACGSPSPYPTNRGADLARFRRPPQRLPAATHR